MKKCITDINLEELREDSENPIIGFFNEYRWLSNFWPAKIYYKSIMFPSSEHAYVYSKGDFNKTAVKELLNSTPGQAKQIGRKVELYHYFDSIKLDIMESILRIKFGPNNPELMQKLIDTRHKELIEFNNWGDTFWGVTPSGNGLNHLGNILMVIREDLIQNAKSY